MRGRAGFPAWPDSSGSSTGDFWPQAGVPEDAAAERDEPAGLVLVGATGGPNLVARIPPDIWELVVVLKPPYPLGAGESTAVDTVVIIWELVLSPALGIGIWALDGAEVKVEVHDQLVLRPAIFISSASVPFEMASEHLGQVDSTLGLVVLAMGRAT